MNQDISWGVWGDSFWRFLAMMYWGVRCDVSGDDDDDGDGSGTWEMVTSFAKSIFRCSLMQACSVDAVTFIMVMVAFDAPWSVKCK